MGDEAGRVDAAVGRHFRGLLRGSVRTERKLSLQDVQHNFLLLSKVLANIYIAHLTGLTGERVLTRASERKKHGPRASVTTWLLPEEAPPTQRESHPPLAAIVSSFCRFQDGRVSRS